MQPPLASLFLVALLAIQPLSSLHAAPTAAEDEAVLMQIERDACNAYLHGDADYLDALLTDDFSATNGRAEVNDKATELAEVRGKLVHYTTFENHGMTLHQHGDTAVVIGRTVVAGAPEGGQAFSVEVQFTDVFTRIGGKWRMVAGHSSRVPKKEG